MTAPGMTGRHLWMPPYLSWSNLPEYDEPLPLRRGAMTIAEKYLVVAVIHDAYRKAGALINPWHADEATEDTELTKEVMRFHTLASVYQDWMKLAKRMEAADVASLNALVAEVEKDLAAAIGGADTPQSAPVVEDSDEQQGQAPALTKNDQRVLLAMGRMDRSILASAVDVADEIDEDERPSVRTIYPAIVRLVELGLAERSEGERQGARLTNKGRALTEKIAD